MPSLPSPAIRFLCGITQGPGLLVSAKQVNTQENTENLANTKEVKPGLEEFRATSVTRNGSHRFVLSSRVPFSRLKLSHYVWGLYVELTQRQIYGTRAETGRRRGLRGKRGKKGTSRIEFCWKQGSEQITCKALLRAEVKETGQRTSLSMYHTGIPGTVGSAPDHRNKTLCWWGVLPSIY